MEHRNDWKSKLTSRKLWMAICGLVSGILIALRLDEHEVTQITGIIMAAGSVIAYIIGEGWADAAGAATIIEHEPETHPPEDDLLTDDGK
ncbi:MAG: hypothetical protein IKO13_04480 [Oscillospiraceae bacterium]|nr:hypothetical protein [Oscillospiraceae bacterium]